MGSLKAFLFTNASILGNTAIADNKGLANEIYSKSRFGEIKDNKIQYMLVEALYLLEKKKLAIKEGKKSMKRDEFIKQSSKKEKNFWERYVVFRDMRDRGYVIKTALKFGADFRVYDRGVKPGDDHAKWILFPVSESKAILSSIAGKVENILLSRYSEIENKILPTPHAFSKIKKRPLPSGKDR